MLNKYRLFQRANGVFYYQDNESGQQRSLWTKDRRAAEKLLHVKNEAHRLPTLNLTMARAYLSAHDVEMSTRTWAAVIKLEVHYVIPNVSSTPNIIHPPHAATLFQRRHLLKGLAVASQFPVALQFRIVQMNRFPHQPQGCLRTQIAQENIPAEIDLRLDTRRGGRTDSV